MAYSIEITILLLIIMSTGMIAFCLFGYYLIKVLQNIKYGRELFVRSIPFSIFMPSNFTDIGNRYRSKLFKSLSIGIISIGLSFNIALLAEQSKSKNNISNKGDSIILLPSLR